MIFSRDGSYRGLRRISILLTAAAIALLVGFLVLMRRDVRVGAPGGPRSPEYSAADAEPQVRLNTAPAEKKAEADPLEEARKALPALKSALKSDPMASVANPIFASPGQGDGRMTVRDGNVSAWFTDRGVTLAAIFPKIDSGPNVLALKWGLVGAKAVEPRPEGELVTRINRLIGDSSQWKTNLPSYSRIAYDEVLPGVDVTIDSKPHALKYTVRLAAGVDPSVLQFRYEGADGVEVAEDGKSLQVVSVLGAMPEGQLEVWQENGGARIPVAARYEKTGANEYAIRLTGVDPNLPLTVDPTFAWGNFIGGSQNLGGDSENGRCMVMDAGNNPWVGGQTSSADFPATAGVMQRKNLGSGDGFVSKFTLNCGLVWSTFIGGSGSDAVTGIKLDSSNNPVIVGTTSSLNFPTTAGAFQPTYPVPPPSSGTTTGFVAKLDGGTAQLIWSSYLGGNAYTLPQACAIDTNNEIYVTGYTECTNLPGAAGNYDATYNGGGDAFVIKVKAGGTGIGWSTYLGGPAYDYATCICVDAAFNSYIGGFTNGAGYPTTGVFMGTAGSYDGFVTKLNPTGTALVFSRLIGGASTDEIKGIAIDTALPPAVYFTGYTYNTGAVATQWPTNMGPTHGAVYDAFITKMQPTGTFLAWSRFLGGNQYDYGYGCAYDAQNGFIDVVGVTNSTDFPCTVFSAGPPTTYTAYRNTLNGTQQDIWVSRLDPSGILCYSSYFGGSGYEDASAVATVLGWFWITGYTTSFDYPTTGGAWSTTLSGNSDVYVTRLNPFQNGNAGLTASTFLGGAHGVASVSLQYRSMGVDAAGNVSIGGSTSAIDYPTTAGALLGSNPTGSYKGVVTKLPADGSGTIPPLWSTYIGGNGTDALYGLAVNPAGEVYITGYTTSSNFPTTGSYRTSLSAGEDVFVSRIKSDGTGFVWSTFLGGNDSDDYGYFVAVDNNNNCYVAGEAYSTTFPTTAIAVKKIQGGGQDTFITKFNSAGTFQYSTYLGGDVDYDYPTGLACDNSGYAYVIGNTYSNDFPIVGGLGTGFDGYAFFLSKVNTNALGYGYSTFIGGSGTEYPTSIVVDAAGSAIVGGYTTSTDYPVTPGAAQTAFRGTYDGFVTKVSAAGNSFDWSTFLGGSLDDVVYSVAVDGVGNVYAAGYTRSLDFPMTPPLLNPFYVGGYDAFATRINAGGSTLAWSTYLGGKGDDFAYNISVGPGGHVYVGGTTGSPDFPTGSGSFSTTKSGNPDLFVARINNDPPAPPGSLAQYRSNGTTIISTGGSTNEPSVIIKGISGDPEGDSYKLQIEVRPVGTPFTSPTNIPVFNVDYFEGLLVPAGTTATATITGRTNPTQYHWQARSMDASGSASAWVTYGGNSEFVPPSTPAATDFRVDTVPPTLSISQANPTYTPGVNIALSGNVSDDVAIFQVQWVNSTTSTSGFATVTAPTWTSGNISLQSGVVNVITVTVTDTAGNVNAAVQQISVVQDGTAPQVNFNSPFNGASFTTNGTSVTITGTTSDLNGPSSMSWQNPTAGTSSSISAPFNNFSTTIGGLVNGANAITIFAVDLAGNVGNHGISIISDPQKPLVAISAPASSGTFYTNASTMLVSGTASDAITSVSSVSYTVNGTPGTAGGSPTNWSFTIASLVNGDNNVNVNSTDAATNVSLTSSVDIFRDPNPPTTLDIAASAGPVVYGANPSTITTNATSITFAGTAADNAAFTSGLLDVKWTNSLTATSGTASGPASWNTGAIGISQGTNTITLTVRDRALNSFSRAVTVICDHQAPQPLITVPTSAGTFLTSGTQISLGGTISDPGGSSLASMSWSTTGLVAPLPTSGSVSFNAGAWPNPAGSLVIDLAGGAQTITITAVDTAGNSNTAQIVVTRDITPPALSITAPTTPGTPFYTTLGSVNIGGSASDASGIQSVTYTVNGTGPFTTTGLPNWSANGVSIGAGSNTIAVTAKDNSNLTTTLSITVIQDTTPPGVSITTPSVNPFVTSNANLSISGTATDNFNVQSVQWSVGGGFTNAALSGGPPPAAYSWNASITLSAGIQTVTIRALDGANNISSLATLTVNLDQTKPGISFSTPASGPNPSFLTSSPVLPATTPPPGAITGTATDNVIVALVEYQVNGGGYATATGTMNLATVNWSIPTTGPTPFTAGANTVDIRATDTAGNQKIQTMTITYDNTPPVVTISTPTGTSPYYTAATAVVLSGSASDANGIQKIEWRNSHPAAGTYAVIAGATTSWTTPSITLDQVNSNAIDIRATDNAGNTAVSTLTVIFDSTAPTITVTAPPAVTKNNSITISGTSSDAGAGVTGISWTRVEVGASGVVTPPFGSWSTGVPLVTGTNTITFTATDGAGNTKAAAAVVVIMDNTNPTVTISSPTSTTPYYTKLFSVDLGGSATDNVALQSLQYQINGGTLTSVTPMNPWTLTGVPVSGTTVINLVATDTATNQGSKSITVIVDTTPPTISVTPPSPSVVNTPSIIISGTASDALSGIATVTWVRTEGGASGPATYTTGPGWTASVPLVAGTNTFTFTATDVAGNTASTAPGAVVVTRDNVNPVPVITAPGFPTYATNSNTLSPANSNALAGTASDNVSVSKVEYRVNGVNPFVATAGTMNLPSVSWSVPSITLSPGSNTIEVLATDSAGNTGLVTLTVTLDTTPPAVAITTPALGTLAGPPNGTYSTGTSPVSIGGTASDAVGIQRIDWTNAATGGSGSTTGTSWSVSIPLNPGSNLITVRSVDTAGNLSPADTLTVTLDTTAAVVNITTPTSAASFATAGTPITISGNSSHPTGIQKLEWRNNGLPAGWNLLADAGVGFALSSSAFSFPVTLSVPTNVIEVRATPKTGTAGIGSITILYDTTPPTATITTNGGLAFATKTSPVLLTGTAGALGISGLQSVVWVNAATSGTQDITNTSWTASISLTPGPNSITVTAKNGAGTAVSKNITVTYDLTPPTVNITGPTTNAIFQTTAPSIAMAGTASDNVALASVKYQVNGGALTDVTAPLTNWTASVPLGGTGVYVINVIATDTAGNATTDILTVTKDIDKPTLTIASPANNSFTNNSPIVVTGTSSDNQAVASITWTNAANSTNGTASGTTNWTAAGITLAPGANIITVLATDALGNAQSQQVTVNYDTTVPVVNIVLPTTGPNWATNAGSIDLSGLVTDNDQVASVSATNAANNVTVVSSVAAFPNWATNGITLLPGANAITVTATDRSGNTSTKVLTVTLDTTNPTVAVTAPVASGGTYVTGAATVQISGTASDDLSVQKVDWANGVVGSGTAAGTTTWVATVPLATGTNTVTFTATDSAGNTSVVVSITVIRDTQVPTINITTPDPLVPAITKQNSIVVSGNAVDLQGMASVTWSNAATGGSGTAANGSAAGGVTALWSATIPLSIGVNTITVTAFDTSGNQSTDTADVTLDITKPTLTISNPTSGPTWVVQGLTVTIGGTTTDNVGLQSVAVTNSAVPGTTSADISSGLPGWTIPNVPLALGTNILTVTSTDKAGNFETAVLTVTSDGTAPSVSITAPTSGSTYYTNQPNVSLGGAASDNLGVQKVDWSNALTGDFGTAIGTSAWASSVPLATGNNVITVTSTDISGRVSLPATITVVLDTTAPVIAVTAPTLNLVPTPPTYTTNLGPVAFGGTVTDAGGVNTVTWTNASTGGSGTAAVDTVPATPTWSASVPLTNGFNAVAFTATDRAGNIKTTTVNVTFDTTPPTVIITGPAQHNFITNAATVTLLGTAADDVAIKSITWVNAGTTGPGSTGSAGSSSPWSSGAITLAPGDNTITVTVTDTAGNTGTDQIIVRQDVTAPTIAFTSPVVSGTYLTNQLTVNVSGTAVDDVDVFGVTINGVPASTVTVAGVTTWSGVVNLSPGSNTITAVATDTAGNVNTGTVSITVVRDNAPPTMAITGHNDGDTYSTVGGAVTLTGTAADPGGALQTVSWANTTTGGSGTATGTGSWTAPIALTPGTNFITITTKDAAGNITQETLTIIQDTQAPTISINTPTAANTYNSKALPSDTIVLGGGAADNVNVASVTWTNAATGGTGGTTGPTTAWSASVPLAVGSNTITVVATDDVGNSSSDVITVTYDPTAPVITITNPTPSPTYSTTVTPLTFAGTASDNLAVASITWSNTTAGAVGTASGSTAWTAPGVPLISGSNTVVFTVTDGVGNTQTATVTVTYDVTPPTVVITPPTTPTQVRPLVLTGTAVDNVGVATVTWSNNLTGSSGTTTFIAPNWSATIPMIDGANVITVKATDALGNLGTATVTVDYSHETVAPTLVIVTPAPPTFTSPTQLITISGTASDNVGVTSISWINKTTRVYGVASFTDPNWTTDVPLADGPNVIDITASDDVGNTFTQTITITFVAPVETNPPSITITAPTSLDTFDVTASPLQLEANAVDDVGVVSVTWTNQGAFGSGDSGWGTFWYASIPLVAGVNLITVTATDTSGNTSSDTITVTYTPPIGDPVPPAVNIVTPLATGTFNVGVPTVDITGTASDNNAVSEVTYSNSLTGKYATATGTTNWQAMSVPLNVGVNVITARAIDPAGNVGQSTLVVVYTPPVGAKPIAPFIPAGMCGLTGMESVLVLGALWLRRRRRRSSL